MLKVIVPPHRRAEIKWIVSVLMEHFLGLEYRIEVKDRYGFRIERNEKSIQMPDVFFSSADTAWLRQGTMLHGQLPYWNFQNSPFVGQTTLDPLPILFGEPGVTKAGETILLNTDIIGSAFFLLSRYEEVVLPDRDEHDRFPGHASVAYRMGFLLRPLVNEYVELLWVFIKRLWPELERKHREFRLLVSHDVDEPLTDAFRPAHLMLKRAAGDIVRRKNIALAVRNGIRWCHVKKGRYDLDPFNTFDFIMSESEKRGLRSSFYFLSEQKTGVPVPYSMQHPWIVELVKEMVKRGHEIGYHAGYNTYLDKELTVREVRELRRNLEAHGITVPLNGGRQHYLRWRTPVTFRNLKAAGMIYDSTLGFTDRVGFRCSTCYEYPAFDIVKGEPVGIVERPLVAMEFAAIADRYQGLGISENTFQLLAKLKQTCKRFSGDFTLLWHNSMLIDAASREFYTALLDA